MHQEASPRLAIGAVVTVALAASISGGIAVSSMNATWDTIRYFCVAREIRQGHGIRTPITMPWQLPDETGTSAFVVQPPLFPLLMTPFGEVDVDQPGAVRVLFFIVHVLASVVSCLLVRRVAGWAAGVAAGVTIASCHAMMATTQLVMPEALFVFFTILAVYLLVSSRAVDARRGRLELLAGLAAALAIGFRYPGILLLGVFAWQGLVRWREAGLRTAVASVARLTAAPLLTLIGLWTRNLIEVGAIRGSQLPKQDRSLTEAAWGAWVAFGRNLGINPWARGESILMILIVLLLAGAVGLRLWRKSSSDTRNPAGGLDLLWWTAVGYAVLIVATMFRYEPRFEKRYFVVLIPFVYLFLFALIGRAAGAWSTARSNWRSPANLAALMLGGLVLGHAIWFSASVWSADNYTPSDQGLEELKAYQQILRETEEGQLLISNRAFELAYFGRRRVMGTPTRGWNSQLPIPDDMDAWLRSRMETHDAEYFIIFADPGGLDAEANGEFLAALSRGDNVSQSLVKVWETEDGVAYRLK